MTHSTIADLARRARLRYIAAGDADGVARQERAIARALAEEAAAAASWRAERENAEAMRRLGELGGLASLPLFQYDVIIGTAWFQVEAADEEAAIWKARCDAEDAGMPSFRAAPAAVIRL